MAFLQEEREYERGREEAFAEIGPVLAALLFAAGGEIRLPRKLLHDNFWIEKVEDPLEDFVTFKAHKS